ncbi:MULTISPECIES: DUF1194 domain-containing protein [unclassified Ensifer]|uniref:DUF1194 domain-containing protein n=1 Tax=unclassified Ensifer TaxID=2633371 RepID=UPI0008132D61|nr:MULTISPECIES: DUF1194 domain-containing protein [unclassified Ensifer]OCP01799.1 hypothetical protein BC362_21570 [Ensifer sp. LC14]OCP09588.1 hypothetical protein BC374_03310 [Ensifer sp. LC13]OCP10760.1 hypothetical protein BBX50_03655 [Ensifer sp. LC11]OCP32835.1 hypothetical protein BC364_03310 [Ensifer sp. LC499]
MTLGSALLACACLLCGSASAEPLRVDLELVLAVDVSYSMEIDEQRLQRQGYVAAFLAPALIKAIENGPLGRIAVTYVEWGGSAVQVTPWTLIDGRGTAAQYSELLRRQPLRRIAFTSISNALAFTRRLFDFSPFSASRRVIDISGDGPNNSGVPAPVARNSTVARGIVIDGLPIMLKTHAASDGASIPDLDAYYRACVIGGDGAFLVKVTDTSAFAEAILDKLVTEISGLEVSRLSPAPVRPVQYGQGYNCFIGEEMQERMIGR